MPISFISRGTIHLNPEGVEFSLPLDPDAIIVGDWIVKGIKGEFYPVKDSIFKLTYEKVEE